MVEYYAPQLVKRFCHVVILANENVVSLVEVAPSSCRLSHFRVVTRICLRVLR